MTSPHTNLFRPTLVVRCISALVMVLAAKTPSVHAKVELPNIFGHHMVLQRGQANRVWGTASEGEKVSVSIAGQRHLAVAGPEGEWQVVLDPLVVGPPLDLIVEGTNRLHFTDVLVGEVWICSGQSNMQWPVERSNDADIEARTARYPKIRMINFPQVGSQSPIWSHDRQWQVCSRETVPGFSAVGYFFARDLHQALDVPIGMINNAWGGSACEAWINRDRLAASESLKPLLERWEKSEQEHVELATQTELDDAGKKKLARLDQLMGGNQRPANIYNGVLKSHLGYGIRGAIWYQGESNAGRAYQYRELFPLMIANWREEWGQGDFPFYWVQLADFLAESPEPEESAWAELREAQTMTMAKLPNTGEAVIIDLGEGKDIHPMNKVSVGRRLARWALANQYQIPVPFRSPLYKSMEKQGNTITLTFDHVQPQTRGWRPFDTNDPRGFAIAGADKKFVWADAKVLGDGRIAVSSEQVPDPVAVRYGWANNPVCNMYSSEGLPLTPFRTDDWKGVTADAN
jgi:sialate O-acetylesterase